MTVRGAESIVVALRYCLLNISFLTFIDSGAPQCAEGVGEFKISCRKYRPRKVENHVAFAKHGVEPREFGSTSS